jgi:dextranase
VSELIPAKATFAPGEPVEIEVRDAPEATPVRLLRLDRVVDELDAPAGTSRIAFGPQAEGGYGVEAATGAATAVDVLADPLSRARYGFVSDYAADRSVEGVGENVRRLHLNAVQFYDWMYRHADLLPPESRFVDALGRELSLDSVRRLVATVADAGSLPLGYAAVYAAGRDEWPEWEEEGLYRADGTPWMLGDFLWNVDPTNDRWLAHFEHDLRRSAEAVGFAGFHLDQYGAPKTALRKDGTVVDLAAAFPRLVDRLAGALPRERLIFNNVNDFPTWSTAATAQAAVYIEVWAPHVRLNDLARLAENAHLLAPGKSVVLAAYLSTFASAGQAEACAAQCLQLAAAFTHGATVLLHGEVDSVLTEAYYVTHGRLNAESADTTRRYYDFAVRYGDLLFERAAVDVTTTYLGGVNEELRLEASVPVSHESRAGTVWASVRRVGDGLLVSLIDLSTQPDDLWDAPKISGTCLSGVRFALERTGDEPRFLFATPDAPGLEPLAPAFDGRHDVVELPPFVHWALVWIPEAAA